MTRRWIVRYIYLFIGLWVAHMSMFFLFYDENVIIAVVTLISAMASNILVLYYSWKLLIDGSLCVWYNGYDGDSHSQEV